MRYIIELSEEHVEALYEAMGMEDYETDDEYAVEDAVRMLIENL